MVHFEINREIFLKSLQTVSGIISARHTIPILSHVLLELTENNMTLTGTDHDISVTSKAVIQKVHQADTVTVPANILIEICRKLPEQSTITCLQQNNQLAVTVGKHIKFYLSCLSAQTFPKMHFQEDAFTFCIPGNLLQNALKMTRFAMGEKEFHYLLNGMLWEIQAGTFQAVASNGHRLARKTVPLNVTGMHQAIVPHKTIVELMRLLEGSENLVEIAITPHQVCIKGSHYKMISRLITGTFPDYQKFIPTIHTNHTATLMRDKLKETLSRLSTLLKNNKHQGIRLEFYSSYLKLSVATLEKESGEEIIEIQYTGDTTTSFSIGFDIRYLADVVDVLPSGQLRFILPKKESTEKENIVLIEHINNQDHLYMIMPMRLNF